MATIAAGNHVEVYVPLAGDITITPGTGGYVEFGCSSPSGESAPEGRRLYAAAAIAIPAGSTMFLRAEGEDATYTDPATGGGVVTAYTSAQLSALAAAGGLTPYAACVASDSGAICDVSAGGLPAWRLSASPVLADGRALYDVAATNSATSTITSATGQFGAGDVGKVCALIPYSIIQGTTRYGTITAVAGPGSCTVSLNGAPGSLTGATFVYGSDNSAQLAALLTAAGQSPHKGIVQLPLGIICTTSSHIVPTGCVLAGVANNPTGGRAEDFKHYGTTLMCCAYSANAFLTIGDTSSSDPRGTHLRDLNVDSAGLASQTIIGNSTNRTEHLFRVTAVRSNAGAAVYQGSPTSRATFCVFMGQNVFNVVQLSGDSTFENNIVTGAGNGYYGVKAGNGDNIAIQNNHIWKDASTPSLLGGSIWISQYSGDVVKGGILISGNKFDVQYGPAVYISLTGTSTMRGVSIVGNIAMNNDSVVNNTGPFLKLSVEAGSIMRGLVVANNMIRGSWNDPTKGQWSAFVDGSAVAGTIYGAVCGGNFADNCNALFTSFTPDHDHGSISMAGTGTTQTKSTTT